MGVIEESLKPRRGRPRKAVKAPEQPVVKVQSLPEPPAAPVRVELEPGRVEQSNCVAYRMHGEVERAGARCSQCGYPGEWTGTANTMPPSVSLPAAEKMSGNRAYETAMFHLAAMVDMVAAKNANDQPTSISCIACDEESEHVGANACACPCHAARAFLEVQLRPNL